MKKQTKILCAVVASVLAAALVVVGVLIWQARRGTAAPKPEELPDSGALALPVVSDFSTALEDGNHTILFKDKVELDAFIEAQHLRLAKDRGNRTAALAVPEGYDFNTHYIFYCYWPLGSHFKLQQCYLEKGEGYISVEAGYAVKDRALLLEDRLMQGYLIALERGTAQLDDAEQIVFQVQEHDQNETEPPLNVGPLRLDLLEPLKPGAASIRVRVIPAEGQKEAPKVTGAFAWTLKEYRGYQWRNMPLAPGKEPPDVQLEEIEPGTFSLLLNAYEPLQTGRSYRAIVRLKLDGGKEEQMLNVTLEIAVK